MSFYFPSCSWNITLLYYMLWSVCFNSEFTISFWKCKYELTCNFFFKFIVMFIIPSPLFLSFKFIERSCYMTEILDKLSIEVYEFQEAFILVGIFYSVTILTLLFSIYTSPLPTTTSRIRISSVLKLHFDCLK